MPTSAVDVVGPAFRHTKNQLLNPFRVTQWLRLALVGLLAGEFGPGGCGQLPVGGGGGSSQSSSDNFLAQALPNLSPVLLVALIATGIVIGLILGVILIYINSMMRFVLFDSVIGGECRIRQFWRHRREAGFRYFVWQVAFSFVMIAGFAIWVSIGASLYFGLGWNQNPRAHIFALVLTGILLFFGLMVQSVIGMLVMVLTKDFVVPQMALENATAIQGWRHLWSMLKTEKGGYTIYILLKIVLSLAAAIALGIAFLLIVLILLIPVGGFGVITVLAGQAIGLTWNVFTIVLVALAGTLLLALVLFIAALLSVPLTVFFPAYSLYFFAHRYSPLRSALFPDAPQPPPITPELPAF